MCISFALGGCVPHRPAPTARAAGGCCSPLTTHRRYAPAFITRSACAAGGAGVLRSMGSPAARFYALGCVARHPVGTSADCLGAQHRGVTARSSSPARPFRRAYSFPAFAAYYCVFTPRGCGRLRALARLGAVVVLTLCGARSAAIILATLRGGCGGSSCSGRSGRSLLTPSTR